MSVDVDYLLIAPEIAVVGAACAVLVLDLGLRKRMRVASGVVALGSLAVAMLLLLANADFLAGSLFGPLPRSTLSGFFVLDGFAFVMKIFFIACAAFVVWISIPPMRGHRYEGEYYFLLLCSVLGTLLMGSSRDLLMLFISLELVSAPAFVIAGLRKHNPRSNEAALKFFLIGVLSAATLAYGISLVYGFTGTTNLAAIADRLTGDGSAEPLLVIGLIFIVAAFGFKVSAVPFHFWAPDTYEGGPTPLAAFLAVASKAAGFVGLLLILLIGFRELAGVWSPLLGGIAVATMTLGNVVALKQRQLIRLLAYSSIGHAGYMLIPLAIMPPVGGGGVRTTLVESLVIYLVIYGVMNFGAFAVAIGASKQYPTLLIRDLAGLGRRAPLAALALGAFLISLGGIPPFAGWFAKFAVFIAAINAGSKLGVVLAVFMVVNSVVSLYYYVGVVRVMYLQDPEEEGAVRFPALLQAAVAVCFAGVLVFGVYPEPIARFAQAAWVAVLP